MGRKKKTPIAAELEPEVFEEPEAEAEPDGEELRTTAGGRGGLRVELAQDEEGNWHWMLFSRNGRPMAQNVDSYPRRNDATKAIRATTEAFADDPEFFIHLQIG